MAFHAMIEQGHLPLPQPEPGVVPCLPSHASQYLRERAVWQCDPPVRGSG